MVAKYFDQPWANAGLTVAISDTVTGDGTANYPQGWTNDYQTAIGSGGKKVSLSIFNQLMLDTTNAIKQLQDYSNQYDGLTGSYVSNTTATWTGVLFGTAYSKTLNTATSGAGGVDTGSIAPSTWYYVWLIYDGSSINVLASLSSTAPTMPSGYVFKKLISSFRTTSSSYIPSFNQIGNEIFFVPITIFSAINGQTSLTSQSISVAVPPIAKFSSGNLNQTYTGASGVPYLRVAADASGTAQQVGTQTATFTNIYGFLNFRDLPLISAQTVYWTTGSTVSANQSYMYITSFKL